MATHSSILAQENLINCPHLKTASSHVIYLEQNSLLTSSWALSTLSTHSLMSKSMGCYNKLQMEWLKNNRHVSSKFQRPEIQDQGSGESPSRVQTGNFSLYHRMANSREGLWIPFHKGTNLFMRAPPCDLITSHKPQLLTIKSEVRSSTSESGREINIQFTVVRVIFLNPVT